VKTLTATNAKNRFGEMIDMAQAGPVRVQRQGRDVAVVLSPKEFRRISEVASREASHAVGKLCAKERQALGQGLRGAGEIARSSSYGGAAASAALRRP
jgi:prevent-host-death family protein